MSLDADGNGGASARALVLERDLVVRALPLCHFTLYYNNYVTLADITELIRHSPNLWHIHTLRCGMLEHERTQARIADLMDSNQNKQLGQAEVITTTS